MYNRQIETRAGSKKIHDDSLKQNAKERLAANAAYNKRNKGQARAIIPASEGSGYAFARD